MKTPIEKPIAYPEIKEKSVRLSDIVHVSIKYLVSYASLQRILFLMAFLTYGIGDALTSIYMMERTSFMRESNPVVRFAYISYGWQGVISLKIWFTFIIQYLVWIISRGKDTYWMINGFLFALFLGGIMAMRANIMAANGLVPPSPGSIMFTFLFLVILFLTIGDLLDKLFRSDITGSAKKPAY